MSFVPKVALGLFLSQFVLSDCLAQRLTIIGGPQSIEIGKAVSSSVSLPKSIQLDHQIRSTSDGLSKFCTDQDKNKKIIVFSTRSMVQKEKEKCKNFGNFKVIRLQLGFFAQVLVQNINHSPLDLKATDLVKALAAEVPVEEVDLEFKKNRNVLWKEVRSDLPSTRIFFHLTSRKMGSRLTFEKWGLMPGCRESKAFMSVFQADLRRKKCYSLRSSIFANEDDTRKRLDLILKGQDGVVGLLSYGVFKQNSHLLRVVPINGVTASHASVAGEDYMMSSPLFVYAMIPSDEDDLSPYVKRWIKNALSEAMIGPKGSLTNEELLPLPTSLRVDQRDSFDRL